MMCMHSLHPSNPPQPRSTKLAAAALTIPTSLYRTPPKAVQENMIQATHTTRVTRWKTMEWCTRAVGLLHFAI
eukprot:scaffold37932_cov173-Skeletonema_marinoi.AAC.1